MDPSVLLAIIAQYRYPILVPAALLWGLLVCMLVGVAVRLGYLELIPAYAAVMLGELIGDVIWYYIGYHWGERFARRWGKYIGIDHWHIDKAKHLFQKYDQRILISSKLTTGFGFAIPILFTAGMTRMSFWRYMWANISGQFFWSGGLIAVGYFFGDLYLSVNSVFEQISVVALALMAIIAGLGFIKFIGRKYLADV